jgi:glycosyltransferase involved in cell wall biosynthesis
VKDDATVLTLPKNSGKGAALKTGMKHIQENMPQVESFITCDADGQHSVEDVCRVRDRLHKGDQFVLTVRKWKKDMPLRSKVGNSLSRIVYSLLTNRFLPDNQSGLRGFKRMHIEWMLKVEKNNYDYEMNVLYYAAKKGLYITTLPIETIYINDNASSHFNPIKDTVRIYKSLFFLARATFMALIAAELAVIAVSLLPGNWGSDTIWLTLPLIGAGAFVVLTVYNQFVVFRKIRCQDHFMNLLYMIIHYTWYTLGCMLLRYMWPQIPLWVSYNICLVVAMPVRYFFMKYLYMIQAIRKRT